MLIHFGWIGSALPRRIIDAVESARKAAPACDVVLHDDESAVPEAWRESMDRLGLSAHMRSDIQRHAVLKRHGGLWLDADVRLLADPGEWAANWDRYTAIRFADRGTMVGTDIIYVPAGWPGWEAVDAYIGGFLREPPARYDVLHLASRMIVALARKRPADFAILPPAGVFPFRRDELTAASVVARGFDPVGVSVRPGLGDLAAAGLSAIGLTEARAQAFAQALGFDDCGCGGRKAWMNRAGALLGLPPGSTGS